MSEDVLKKLSQILKQRKDADPNASYVAKLYDNGLDSILKKIGEEATETVMAAKDGDKKATIYETADLWFHCMVMLAHENIEIDEILQELDRRFGISGLEEKASRSS